MVGRSMNGSLVSSLLGIAALLAAGIVQAAPLQWTLNDALFDDGTVATGSFIYEADSNTYSDWNVLVQDGTLSAFTYDTTSSQLTAVNMDATGVLFVKNDFTRYINFNFVSPLTDAGGSIPLALFPNPGDPFTTESYECDNCNNVRYFVGGDVMASSSSVPEPGTLALTGLILAGLGFARRRAV